MKQINWRLILGIVGIWAIGMPNATNQVEKFIYPLWLGFLLFVLLWKWASVQLVKTAHIILIAIFILTSWLNSNDVRKHLQREPTPETYRSDLDDFLRTYYLMEKGQGYYISFSQAVSENAFKSYIAPNIWSWRLPTIFYFWKLLPTGNGVFIYFAFVVLSSISLYFVLPISEYFFSKDRLKYAILSPYLLYPYFHFAARDLVFLHTEWWAIMISIIAVYLWVKQLRFLSVLAFSLAVITRELLIFPFIIVVIIYSVLKKQLQVLLLLPLIILSTLIVLHYIGVTNVIGNPANLFTPRIHRLSYQILQATLAFGSWEYIYYKIRIFIVFYILSFVGILFNHRLSKAILMGFIIFPFSFLFLGSSNYNDYWGIFYIPWVAISAPLILNKI